MDDIDAKMRTRMLTLRTVDSNDKHGDDKDGDDKDTGDDDDADEDDVGGSEARSLLETIGRILRKKTRIRRETRIFFRI